MYKVLFKRLYSHTYTHVDRHACSYTVWKDSQVTLRRKILREWWVCTRLKEAFLFLFSLSMLFKYLNFIKCFFFSLFVCYTERLLSNEIMDLFLLLPFVQDTRWHFPPKFIPQNRESYSQVWPAVLAWWWPGVPSDTLVLCSGN